MLLIDGAKYELWSPPSEDEFEQVVKEHVSDIFGVNSIYLDIKQKLKSKAGIGSIPDGYTIILENPPCWQIVEIELSNHPLYAHIVPQITKFINGVRSNSTQKEIVNLIYEIIEKNDDSKLKVRNAIKSNEIYKFLSDLIVKPPELTVLIEQSTDILNEALNSIANLKFNIVEFQTFVKVASDFSYHAHLFKPIFRTVEPPISLPVGMRLYSIHGPRKARNSQGNCFACGQEIKAGDTYKHVHASGEKINFCRSCEVDQSLIGKNKVIPMVETNIIPQIELTVKKYFIKHKRIQIPKEKRRGIFPSEGYRFELDTDVGKITTKIEYDGQIWTGMSNFFSSHPELKIGDTLIIEVIEPMKQYQLRKA